MSAMWKACLQSEIRGRNERQVYLFKKVYTEYSILLKENLALVTKIIDFERLLQNLQCEIRDECAINCKTIEVDILQHKFRILLDTLRKRRKDDDTASTFSYFLNKTSELQNQLLNVTEELKFAKTELAISYDKFSKYEYDLSRYKSDIETVCIENERLRKLLTDHNISIDAFRNDLKL